MSSINRFRPKVPAGRSVDQRAVPATLGDCVDCGAPIRVDRYHDCGEQLELVYPEPTSKRRKRR